MNEKKSTVLICNICNAIVRSADDLGFGYRGTPKVGDTHVCDRFQYGVLRQLTNSELDKLKSRSSAPVPPPDRPTTDERIAQIKARVERATPEPWSLGKPDLKGRDAHMCEVMTAYATKNDPKSAIGAYDIICRTWSPDHMASSIRWSREDCYHNADFIAAARSDVPFLLERIEELERELENYREQQKSVKEL